MMILGGVFAATSTGLSLSLSLAGLGVGLVLAAGFLGCLGVVAGGLGWSSSAVVGWPVVVGGVTAGGVTVGACAWGGTVCFFFFSFMPESRRGSPQLKSITGLGSNFIRFLSGHLMRSPERLR